MQVLDGLMVVVAVLSGMAGGIFFTFSNFVMPALGRLPKAHGVAAMQGINITVINPGALGIMLGTGLIALAGGVLAVVDAEGRPCNAEFLHLYYKTVKYPFSTLSRI
ncbi:MAG: hypothetical protein AAF085_17960 [Planctomycetota bacterium]